MTDTLGTGTDGMRPVGLAVDGRHAGGLHSDDLLDVVDGLERRLASQPVIEQSKGILMGHFGIDADTAFAVLRRWSSQTNVKLRDISQMIVRAAATGSPGM